MPPVEVLAELERLAARIGVAVRRDPFDLRVMEGNGGLCWLRGKPVVVLDAGAPVLDLIAVMAEALAHFDLEPIYLPPLVRARLEAGKRRRRGVATVTRLFPADGRPPSPRPTGPGLKRTRPER